jgi:FAD:protein FMN transferase
MKYLSYSKQAEISKPRYFGPAPWLLTLVFQLFFSIPLWSQTLDRYEFTRDLMGTRFRLILYTSSQEKAQDAARASFARLEELDHIMSDYKSDSELMLLCQKAGSGPVPVSPDLFRVLQEAQHWAKQTGGAFDCTVGPMVQLWRRSRRQKELPDPDHLAKALSLSGHQKLRLDPTHHTTRLLLAGMRLDLGGIGKGFASDEVLRLLKKRGIRRAMVVAGGEMAAGDPPPGKPGWWVEVAPLESALPASPRFVLLRQAAISTSGDASQFVEIGGVRYSHILDPRTGLGLTGRRSVSVMAPRGSTSDALATALNVLGPDRGMNLVNSLKNVSALFLEATPQGLRDFHSKHWRDEGVAHPLQKAKDN